MAGKIKGISIEISGNTTKLGKALNDIDQDAKVLSNELKSIDSLLKFNPDSVELLTQKQELLTKEINNTSKKLKVLKDSQEQVENQWKNGDIGDEELRAFQREIVATEGKLNNYQNELKKTNDNLNKLENGTSSAGKSMKDFEKDLKDAKEKMDEINSSAKEMAEDIGKLGAAIAAGATYAVISADNTTSALNSLQAQTGLASEEMAKYKSVLEDIYRQNYGENMEEIANVMAMIKKYTGETDPSALKELTISAITLRDTFDMDFSETMRGIDALMKNMGVDAQTAFDLMAKGAQNGLDKSGELADNIAEYSQLWSQAGFSAEEMFAILDNGLNSGAYNLDKVNDFVKEFTISLADGRIKENIGSFTTKTADLFDAWEHGEATSKEVFQSIINDLASMENQQDALTIASNVWSAVGEDNSMKVITSLNEVNDKYKDVEGAMKDIQDVKYNDLKNDLSSLGRQIQLDIIQPIGEELVPVAKAFFEYVSENIDEILPSIVAFGTTFAAIFVINKVAKFTESIGALSVAFRSLFLVIAANPMVAVSAGLIGVAVATVAVYNATHDVVDVYGEAFSAARQMTEAEQQLTDTINASTEAYRATMSARSESTQSISNEYSYYQQLWDELQTIVEANGEIKEGYEDRASVITSTLSDALGIEIELTDGVINKYDELQSSIESIIETKRAEAIVNANESAYAEAIENKAQAFKDYTAAIDACEETHENIIDAQNRLTEAQNNLNSAQSKSETEKYEKEIKELEGTIDGLSWKYSEQQDAVEAAGEAYSGYMSVISNYEGMLAAIASGDVDEINNAITNLTYNFKTSTTATKTELQKQVTALQSSYDDMVKAVEEGAPGVTQAQVEEMSNLVEAAKAELDKLPEEAGDIGYDTSYRFEGGLHLGTGGVTREAYEISRATNRALGSADSKSTGTAFTNSFITGIKSMAGSAGQEGKNTSTYAKQGMSSVNAKDSGASLANTLIGGVQGQNTTAYNAGTTLATNSRSGMQSVSAYSAGTDFGQGFANGVNDKQDAVRTAANALANIALNAMALALKINSPSKVTTEFGEYTSEGFAVGMESTGNMAKKAAKDVAEGVIDEFDIQERLENFTLFDEMSPMTTKMVLGTASPYKGASSNDISINVNIKEFVNNRQQDVRAFANELLQYAQEIKESEDRAYA